MEFSGYSKIENYKRCNMFITQKIHGSNGQIFIFPDETGVLQVLVGSRNRWITPEDDNFGFARFVENNKLEIIEKLGEGKHFGEWAGPGINSGEGLSEKAFVLFDHLKFPEDRILPAGFKVVPVLYKGKPNNDKVEEIMQDLKTNGSKLSAGFMRPEGIVIDINGIKYKHVFTAEETQWSGVKKNKEKSTKEPKTDYSHLLQPIRLQKLLSKDERLVNLFPSSISDIIKLYIQDLIEEGQAKQEEEKDIRVSISRDIVNMTKEKLGV